jgi:hypothetical protein
MADAQTKAIIAGSVRTLVQFVPIVGGAVAQAWSEFEGYQRNARIEEFFAQFRTRLEALESDASTIKELIKRMEDFPRLLEDTVDAVRRESDDRKREVYPIFLVNLILQSETIAPDERSFLLETLDSLTEHDLNVLRQFEASGRSRGDILTQTAWGEFAPVGVQSPFNTRYERVLAPFMISTAKLEARGIIFPVPDHGAFSYSGTGGEWYDTYRQRAWKLMPVGRDLLKTLSPMPSARTDQQET